MHMVLIPGYRELFGTPPLSYEEFVQDLPSEVVISLAIMLNNELNAPLPTIENQNRLRQLMSWRFPDPMLGRLNAAFALFREKTNGTYDGYVFGRRYLVAMIIKELKRNAVFEFKDTSPQQEYNFLMAYLLTVDEVNEQDRLILDIERKHKGEPLFEYRMLWTPNINQFQFNDNANVVFELFKLLSFSSYAFEHYREYFKVYLNQLHFDSVGMFMGSFYQVAMATLHYDGNEALSKLAYIKPNEVDEEHLASLTINQVMGNENVSLGDLKRMPLFQHPQNGYMVIDGNMYHKKMYKGPYFDLFKSTELSKQINFNTYSSAIAKEVMEGICFQSIVKPLHNSKYDVLRFDDDSDNVPDGYFRRNNDVFLIEFKAYLFPEGLPENPDFDAIKKYIDERFIANEKGKGKGIGQIVNQVDLLFKGGYEFDKYFKDHLAGKQVSVYPVICFDEFHFTMPGINQYLNNAFNEAIDQMDIGKLIIKPVTLISLEVMFDICMRGGTFKILQEYIDRYWKIIKDRKRKYAKMDTAETFLDSFISFDELYYTILCTPTKDENIKSKIYPKLNAILGVSNEFVDTKL